MSSRCLCEGKNDLSSVILMYFWKIKRVFIFGMSFRGGNNLSTDRYGLQQHFGLPRTVLQHPVF